MNKRKGKQQAGALVERGTSADAINAHSAEQLAKIHGLNQTDVFDWIERHGLDFSDPLVWETYSTGGANDIINDHTGLLDAKLKMSRG